MAFRWRKQDFLDNKLHQTVTFYP